MAKSNVIPHKVPAAVKAWLKKEVELSKKLHRKIAKEMDSIAPKRAKWYAAFYKRIQTRGFTTHFTELRQVGADELPKKPKRKDRVVW
jgi:hypothetical protein